MKETDRKCVTELGNVKEDLNQRRKQKNHEKSTTMWQKKSVRNLKNICWTSELPGTKKSKSKALKEVQRGSKESEAQINFG